MLRRLVACLVCIVATAPARAASVTTLGFIAAARPANEVLDQSSRLAEANGASRRVLALARHEADRAKVVEAFVDWAIAEHRTAEAEAHAPSIDGLGPVFGAADRLVTVVVPPLSLGVPPEARPDLRRLAALQGADFDALYAATQVDMLRRLVSVYRDFIKNGDDETLRALAVRDLPRAEALLAQAQRL